MAKHSPAYMARIACAHACGAALSALMIIAAHSGTTTIPGDCARYANGSAHIIKNAILSVPLLVILIRTVYIISGYTGTVSHDICRAA